MDSTIDPSRPPSRERRRIVSLATLLVLGFTTSMLLWGIARTAVSGTPDSRAMDERQIGRSVPGGDSTVGFEVRTGDKDVLDGFGGRSTRIRVDAVARVLNIAAVTALAVLWFRWKRR